MSTISRSEAFREVGDGIAERGAFGRVAAVAAVAVGLAFVLFLHGAVPFVATPSDGQLYYVIGYAQSIANDGLLTLRADSFGGPAPSPPVIGLPLIYVAAVATTLGIQGADAYAASAAVFLALSFFACRQLGRMFGAGPVLSAFGAVAWLSLPIVWGHDGYQGVCYGIALLPFYFWTLLMLVRADTVPRVLVGLVLFMPACTMALFMDGYSFMMFACGSVILVLAAAIGTPGRRIYLLGFVLPTVAIGFTAAYLLYAGFVGRSQFAPAAADFFRGWGLDLAFVFVPPSGLLAVWDWLGWNAPRSQALYYGDESTWRTTFLGPVLVAGLAGCFIARPRAIAAGLLLVAILATYMALGPSLKIDAVRSAAMIAAGEAPALMPPEAAPVRTGNLWLYEHVPGFRNMRASYRWSALAAFALWALLMLAVARARGGFGTAVAGSALGLVVVASLPHLARDWETDRGHRAEFLKVEAELILPLASALRPDERVAILPYGNDFLANYLAPRLGIRTFNIGGDKNAAIAREKWPPALKRLEAGGFEPNGVQRIANLLTGGHADAIVLADFDFAFAPFRASRAVPPKPVPRRVLTRLKNNPALTVDELPNYFVVRLRPAPPPAAGEPPD